MTLWAAGEPITPAAYYALGDLASQEALEAPQLGKALWTGQ